MQHWLFDASDYHLIDSKNSDDDLDEENRYWDDFDADIWGDESEYDG